MGEPCRIPSLCTTQLTLRCRVEDREKIKAAIPLAPDDELPDRLVYGLEESRQFGGTWADLDTQFWVTALLLAEAEEALIAVRKSFNISYRLEAYCDFYWREQCSDEYWCDEVVWLSHELEAPISVEAKWRDEQMWRCGLPLRHMTPEPCFEEIEDMAELEPPTPACAPQSNEEDQA